MKNRTLPWLVILFSLMLTGILGIQAWWIKHAFTLSAKAFDNAVYRSLEAVVKQNTEEENYGFIQKQINTDSLLMHIKQLKRKKRTRAKKSAYSSSYSIHINNDDKKGQGKTIIHIENNENGNKTVKNRVIIGASANIDSLGSFSFAEASTPAVIEDKVEEIEVLVEKMMEIHNPDSLSLKPEAVRKLLSVHLMQNNLPGAFSFALYNKKKDGNVSYMYKSEEYKDTLGAYQISLYPNDLFGRKVVLALSFPEKKIYLQPDVWWVFALSLVFTSAILFLFAYSIRMLIRHKNLLEIKNDFINHMSHELKTPLATISLGADMLIGKADKMDETQIQKVASSVKKQSMRLHEDMKQILMNALLDNYQAKEELFDLAENCKQAISEMQFLLDDKKASVETHFEPEQLFITGDAGLWHKVFTNLLDNALKFSKENPKIHISIIKSNHLIKMKITDNGIGIVEKDLIHIFEKFYRSDYYKKSNIQGFGLGLSFVKKVVQLHKGTIKAESELNKGTSFIIELPSE